MPDLDMHFNLDAMRSSPDAGKSDRCVVRPSQPRAETVRTLEPGASIPQRQASCFLLKGAWSAVTRQLVAQPSIARHRFAAIAPDHIWPAAQTAFRGGFLDEVF